MPEHFPRLPGEIIGVSFFINRESLNFNSIDLLFSNRKLARDDPRIIDLGPTVLDLFGIDTPAHMTGRTLL